MFREGAVAVLFKGETAFENVNSMVNSFARAFTALGVECVIIHSKQDGYGDQLRKLFVTRPIAFFFSLNGIGVPSQGSAFYNDIPVPLFTYFLDRPFHIYLNVMTPIDRHLMSFPSAQNVSFCRDYLRGSDNVFHFAHGADALSESPWEERDIDILYVGSFYNNPLVERVKWREKGKEVEGQLNDMLALHDADPKRAVEDCVIEVLGNENITFKEIHGYAEPLDRYLRDRERINALKAMKHLPMVVAGRGWDRFLGSSKNVTSLGEQPALAMRNVMQRSKIVLNPQPAYYDSHERAFNAMAAGAATLTARCAYMEEQFGDDALLFYEKPAAADAPDLIEAALKDDARLKSIAERGRAKQVAGHTWQHRAEIVLEKIQQEIS